MLMLNILKCDYYFDTVLYHFFVTKKLYYLIKVIEHYNNHMKLKVIINIYFYILII